MRLYNNPIKALLIFLAVAAFCIWQNNHIVITEVNYENTKINNDLHGYKIVHISDLHNKKFGRRQRRLLEKIKKLKPNIIVVTGDLVDSRRTNIDIAMEFINGAVEIAPVYYVSGNHEIRGKIYEELKEKLLTAGAHVMDNTKTQIEVGSSKIELIGLMDPLYRGTSYLRSNLEKLTKNESEFLRILLSHRPNFIDIYAESKVDLVFCGHAHGGQVRLPFIGGIIAPDQGLIPKYTSGVHTLEDTTMVISRGLGNSIIPIRIFNRPEIIAVTLREK